VRVPYGEGVANRIGPEPCAGTCEGAGEASVGECIGQPLSRVRFLVPGADTVAVVEGNTRYFYRGGATGGMRAHMPLAPWLVCEYTAYVSWVAGTGANRAPSHQGQDRSSASGC
jgi:hypothetical protein